MGKIVRVLHHDNCFDGLASAAVFSAFYRSHVDADAEFVYDGLAHGAGDYLLDEKLSGEVNAIVDFKYSASDWLTWWFDHHQSAFLSAEDQIHFSHEASGRKFHDTTYRSCTKLIDDISRSEFACSLDNLKDLIHWADIIDGAQFESAQAAVELKEPALRLMLVIESVKDRELLTGIICAMQERDLAQVAEEPRIKAHFERLYDDHLNSIKILKKAMTCTDGVVEFDVSEHPIRGHNKFIPYWVFPESTYNVGVTLEPSRAKVSVGTNPWASRKPRHNLAEICERYGGGGHAVVAAISFDAAKLDEAQRAAREIAETLRRDAGADR